MFFTFFYRYSSSMLPWESKFGAKFLFMAFNRKIIWVVHPLCAWEGNLRVKTPVLVWLITK